MKVVVILVSFALVFLAGCSRGVDVAEFDGIYPGMACGDLDNYLKDKKMSFKKDGNEYGFDLKGKVWSEAEVECDHVVTAMEFDSKKGSSAKGAKAYIDAQTSLMNAFRDNMITYEEGNKIINLNNGVRLHQFPDSKSGTIARFKISVDNVGNAAEAWKKAAPLLSQIGND